MKMFKLRNKNNKEYCGKCIVCKKVGSSKQIKEDVLNRIPKIYRILYEENICFVTKNKISRDKRYKDNIRIENKYTKKIKKKSRTPTKSANEKELEESPEDFDKKTKGE